MKRSEVEKKYLWALEDVYASDDLWEKDYKELDKSVNFVSAYKGKLSDKVKLLELLKKSDEIEIKLEKLYSYAKMYLPAARRNSHR